MISILKLFEISPGERPPSAVGPMKYPREYVDDRIRALKQQFSFGRIKAASYQAQLNQLLKEKNNKLSGSFVEK